MNLTELQLRTTAAAIRSKLTLEGFLSDFGVNRFAIRRGASGTPIDTTTAIRLLPLVDRLLLPGEVSALELSAGHQPVAICPAALVHELAALRAEVAQLRAENTALRTFQPN